MKSDFSLQKVDPTFNDTTGEYYNAFEDKLSDLSGKTSETDLCIEEYLVDSEKAWFKKLREERLRKRESSPNPFGDDSSLRRSRASYGSAYRDSDDDNVSVMSDRSDLDEFLLGPNYQRPSFLKRTLQRRIGDWPIYSFLLALGQIIAANSYQITLLTGGQAQTPEKLYILGAVFIVTSCIWWVMFRTLKSKFVLSVPFIFYGLAFLFVGMAPFLAAGGGRNAMQYVASGCYVAASSSGSIFFALNFGDEGKFPYVHPSLILLIRLRWSTDQVLDIPRMHDPRNAANLPHSLVLLGKYYDDRDREWKNRT